MSNHLLILTAITAALEAGKRIKAIYNQSADTDAFRVSFKDDQSPLTVADLIAHDTIVLQLGATGLPVLSEEAAGMPFSERKKWDLFWLVDPLDGTKEFINRNGEFTVNIALVENNAPILGVIYVPVSDVLYFGSSSTGSYKLEEASKEIAHYLNDGVDLQMIISKSHSLPLQLAPRPFTVVASRSHLSPETELLIENFKKQHGDLRFMSKGSSLKICLVAEGTADVYPRLAPTMEWDTAAGQAIAVSAGCKVTMHPGDNPVTYNKENLLNPHFVVSRN
jgi:3'(2'), 5'-bisphosphate nucleotidase